MTKTIAIIGAGIAGLRAAQIIGKQAGDKAVVTVFEKSRGVGGRMATRYADPYKFDHGAQYFTAHTTAFKSFLEPLIKNKQVAQWRPRIKTDHKLSPSKKYVGEDQMNVIGKSMMKGLDVLVSTRIASMENLGGVWYLTDEAGTVWGQYDAVIVAAPAEQAQTLISQDFADRAALDSAKMLPCFTVMLAFAGPWTGEWDAISTRDTPISWASVNSAKPGRDRSHTTMVLQSQNEWAAEHVDMDKTAVMKKMLQAFVPLSGVDVRLAKHAVIHRWLYANVATPAGKPFLGDAKAGLYACGDWCLKGRVEAAFTSGQACGEAVVAAL